MRQVRGRLPQRGARSFATSFGTLSRGFSRQSYLFSHRREECNGDSKSGSRGVWADGVGNRAGVRGGEISYVGARSFAGASRQGAEGNRQESGAAGGEGKTNCCSARRNSRTVEGDDGD